LISSLASFAFGRDFLVFYTFQVCVIGSGPVRAYLSPESASTAFFSNNKSSEQYFQA
jgi:hypothetical protein